MLWAKGHSGFSSFSTAEEVTTGIDASGLTAIITGASSGIGAETARVFALRGARVILGVRNTAAGRRVKEEIVKQIAGAEVDVMELDLSSMASVRKFASEFKSAGLPLNLLINNAGISVSPFKLSADGIELQFATNHLGHFLLTDLLVEVMKETSIKCGVQGRIVNVSSIAHFTSLPEGICFEKISDESSYQRGLAYQVSKLANVLHAKELSRRFQEEGVNITANSLHPGIVRTNVLRHLSFAHVMMNLILRPFIKDIHQGAATTCYIALHSDNIGVSGEYFSDCNVSKTWPQASDMNLARKVWEFSMNLINSDSH